MDIYDAPLLTIAVLLLLAIACLVAIVVEAFIDYRRQHLPRQIADNAPGSILADESGTKDFA